MVQHAKRAPLSSIASVFLCYHYPMTEHHTTVLGVQLSMFELTQVSSARLLPRTALVPFCRVGEGRDRS